VLIGALADFDAHVLQVGKNLGRDHHDFGPRFKQLAGLPRRHRAAADHHATPGGEVQKYRIKKGVSAFDLRSQLNEQPVG
jgi:hypothetical protein